MKRYETIAPFGASIVDFVDRSNSVFGESVTDDSFYVPEKELIKRLKNGVAYGQALAGEFDFRDGKDTGLAVPIDRYKGIDIAEVTEYARAKSEACADSLKADIAEAKRKADDAAKAVVQQASESAAASASVEAGAAGTTVSK